MFTKSAAFYDLIYHWKDYQAEAQTLHEIIQQRKESSGNTLLDVACGTGAHLVRLREHYAVEGLDLDERMLAIAHERLPDVAFHRGDMQAFDLGKTFDVVVCLFSSIGYVPSLGGLQRALSTFAQHTKPGGVVIVEPWFAPGDLDPKHVSAAIAEAPDMKVVRMSRTELEDRRSTLVFHYLVGSTAGIDHFTERHEMWLYTHDEYMHAFHAAGLEVSHDPEGLMGRGLYVGLRR